MSYIGISYNGTTEAFLRNQVDRYSNWLNGDRKPRFVNDSFVILYDSNTAREFVKKCTVDADKNSISVYTMQLQQ